MTPATTKTTVLAAQRRWSLLEGLSPDSRGYLSAVALNLRQERSAKTLAAFKKADGAELEDKTNAPAKMRAPHASSTLGFNVFSYWEDRADLTPLLATMGVRGTTGVLEFELKLPTGAGGTPPSVDIVIITADGLLVGVESKFAEWMTPK